MAVPSPQDLYARLLVSGRGYPLWTPEPDVNLPDVYVQQGFKIGDVGVVVPTDGSFDVFFNICLPATDPVHQETGVPDNFTPISLNRRDIAKFPKAEAAGRIISTSSVTWVSGTEPPDGDPARHAQPGPLNYEFILSSREGAVLILPEGAERYYLRNESRFRDEAMRHAVDWYTFAEERLGRIVSHDSLYLITGLYKAQSWSVATYQQGQGAGIHEASAQFRAVQVGGGNIMGSYTWQTTHSMDWRVGPSDQYYNGIPNQTVFIQGFKIAVREGILGTKWVNVKADFPSVRPRHAEFSSGSWLSYLWGGSSSSGGGLTANTPRGRTTSNMDAAGSNLPANKNDSVAEDITVHRFPQVAKPFHPSDIINRYLLRKVPSAIVAVTHDSHWITLLDEGFLSAEDILQEDRLIASVINNYSIVLSHGAVSLRSKAIENAVDSDATIPSTFSEGHSTPPDTPAPDEGGASSDLPPTDDPSSGNPDSSHATTYRRARHASSDNERASLHAPEINQVNYKASQVGASLEPNYTSPQGFPNPNTGVTTDISSKPLGNKRALLIAIQHVSSHPGSKFGGPSDAVFAHRDAEALRTFLIVSHGYRWDDIILMKDDTSYPKHLRPTRRRILRQINLLTNNIPENCQFFFYLSGHGGDEYCHDLASTSVGGRDSEIDFAVGQPVLDHILYDRIIEPLEKVKGSKLFALFDCCHSQTLLDLPRAKSYERLRVVRPGQLFKVVAKVTLVLLVLKKKHRHTARAGPSPPVAETHEVKGLSVICLSASRDGQIVHHREQGPTFTECFMEAAAAKPNLTWTELRGSHKELISTIQTKYEATSHQRRPRLSTDSRTPWTVPTVVIAPVSPPENSQTVSLLPPRAVAHRRATRPQQGRGTAAATKPPLVATKTQQTRDGSASVSQTIMRKDVPPHPATAHEAEIRHDIDALVGRVRAVAMAENHPTTPGSHADWAGDEDDHIAS